MKLKYVGETIVDLHNEEEYEAEQTYDPAFGECYSIKDGSGDSYLYSEEYVKENFVVVE